MSDPRAGCEVVTTRTGARAMLDRAAGEVMHPLVGPAREAEQLYVTPSRLALRLGTGAPDEGAHDAPLVLLDVGLGAGSNALAALRCARALAPPKRCLHIVSFERDLTAFELAMSPEHVADFGFDEGALTAGRALASRGAHREPGLVWELRLGDLADTLTNEPAAIADVVFWDPFSPRANPALWTMQSFLAVRRLCRSGATLHTYSGATATRAALLLAGFCVGAGDATGDKAQTTIASVDLGDLEAPLGPRFFERVRRSSAPFPADAPEDARERIEALPQLGG
jgi:queuine tRNA-ribosyltransferase